MGIDRGRLAELDVARLGFGDLQSGFQLVALNDFGNGGSHGNVLADLDRRGKGRESAGDAGMNLESGRLLVVEIEEGLGLINLGLVRRQLNLDGLLIDIE